MVFVVADTVKEFIPKILRTKVVQVLLSAAQHFLPALPVMAGNHNILIFTNGEHSIALSRINQCPGARGIPMNTD